MTEVSSTLRARWRSKKHVGSAKPTLAVELRRGLMDRHYAPFEMLDGSEPSFGKINGSAHNAQPWQAYWRNTGSWVGVPNIASVDIEQQISDEGIAEPTTCTIVIENVVYAELEGPGGLYHLLSRGHLAPWRGFQSPGRPTDADAVQNAWYEVLNGGFKVRVHEGYGDATEPTFVGLIDDCDVRSAPDQITLTCRSFGVMLNDQRVFGWNKPKEIRSPIVFAGNATTKEGRNASASTSETGHPASDVLKVGDKTFWFSHGHSTPGNTEYVEIRLPKGRYSKAYLHAMYGGMDAYLSIYARSAKLDGVSVANGWIDGGLGDVPGSFGGVPYVKRWRTLDEGGHYKEFPWELECGDNTILRFSFRNLGYSPSHDDYRAKVARLIGLKRDFSELNTKHWIETDDATDVVKWALMWAGFKEWVIEPMGVPIKNSHVFHQSDHLIDIVKWIVEQANYCFYIDQPSDDDSSLGVPHLVRNSATHPPQSGVQEVRDTDLLTGVQTKFSKEALAYIIRTRGKQADKAHWGVPLNEDRTRRIMAVYWPPWSGAHRDIASGQLTNIEAGRLSFVNKHIVHTDDGIELWNEAMMSNLLIALYSALSSFVGTFEMPGFPGFSLNEQLSVMDTPSGVNTRVWLSSISSHHSTGEQAEWTTTVEGAMLDTLDILYITRDIQYLLDKTLEWST